MLAGHPAAALEQAQTLLRGGPEPRALRLAAAALRRLGKPADAEAAEIAAIQQTLAGTDIKQAAAAEMDGRSAEARSIVEQMLRRHPDDLLALTMIAEAAMNQLDLERAETALRTVLARAGTFLRASVLLAKCLALQARASEAIAVLEEVLGRKPRNLPALRQLAPLLTEIGRHEQAAHIYERLLAEEDGKRDHWINYAQSLRFLGRKEDSRAAFRHALSIDPRSGSAWWGLANFFPADLDAEDEEAVRKALADRADDPREASALHIALSVLADRRGEYAKAFDHIAIGKQLRLAIQPYDPDWTTAAVDQSVAFFPPERFAARRPSTPYPSPIFIVGMPRSGSTLIERILSQHSVVEGAGELPLIQRLVNQLRGPVGAPADYRALVASMTPDKLAELGQWYLDRSRDFRRSDKPLFIDKWNSNWLHLGLIRLILPGARIIDIRRSALDCCWSNFKLLFAEGHPAANDLRHIGRFYRDYVRMIDSIQAVAPTSVLTVRYENVVDNVETETRRMLDFIGLDYESACVDFHLSTMPVATPSSEQVRRPLNSESVGSAEHYRPWLGPLIEELGPFARSG